MPHSNRVMFFPISFRPPRNVTLIEGLADFFCPRLAVRVVVLPAFFVSAAVLDAPFFSGAAFSFFLPAVFGSSFFAAVFAADLAAPPAVLAPVDFLLCWGSLRAVTFSNSLASAAAPPSGMEIGSLAVDRA